MTTSTITCPAWCTDHRDHGFIWQHRRPLGRAGQLDVSVQSSGSPIASESAARVVLAGKDANGQQVLIELTMTATADLRYLLGCAMPDLVTAP